MRYFERKAVSKEDVLQLLELARLAPSVENIQPWHFHVVTRKKLIEDLKKTCCYGNFIQGSSVFIIITCNRSLQSQAPMPLWNERELELSCMSAVENILLGVTSMGLGACFVSLHHGPAHSLLGLPKHEVIVGAVMIGHCVAGEERLLDARDRKPLEEIYTFHE
jgi:nitroreductase